MNSSSFFNSTTELMIAIMDERAGFPCLCETRSLFDAILIAHDISPKISDARDDISLSCDLEVSEKLWDYMEYENTRWSDLLVGDPFFWDDECTVTTEVRDMVRDMREMTSFVSVHLCDDRVVHQVDYALGVLLKSGAAYVQRTLNSRIARRSRRECDCTG